MEPLEPRIIELESRYTLQQAMLQDLNDVLIAQQKEIDHLKAEVAWLKQKLEATPGLVDASASEKPPHY